ncbi:MAG TPA: class I SAM-dependent methyltransferase [Oligoflexia bacterium]|nr:class I SAM-dependent methyltransferase [Oligoflexia bacterium]HMP48519.1 class I SAM-dependent methyltransferase [Oligoflexia bacterium]
MPGAHQFIEAGISLLKSGNYEGAEPYFLEALRILPSSARALVGAGAIKARKGLKYDALRDFYVALSINGASQSLRDLIRDELFSDIFRDLVRPEDLNNEIISDDLRELKKLISHNFLLSKSDISDVNDRTSFINYLITEFSYKKYLEIGCHDNQNFDLVLAPYKIGVDPVCGGNIRLSSDDYFALSSDNFDIIFIDGLHHSEQVLKDARNALSRLNKGGVILLHDCNPRLEIHQSRKPLDYIWNGDVWKAFIELRKDQTLDARVADFDHGIGVLKMADNTLPLDIIKNYIDLSFSELQENIESWLRPGNASEILRWLSGS